MAPRYPSAGRQCARHQDSVQGKGHEEQVGETFFSTCHNNHPVSYLKKTGQGRM